MHSNWLRAVSSTTRMRMESFQKEMRNLYVFARSSTLTNLTVFVWWCSSYRRESINPRLLSGQSMSGFVYVTSHVRRLFKSRRLSLVDQVKRVRQLGFPTGLLRWWSVRFGVGGEWRSPLSRTVPRLHSMFHVFNARTLWMVCRSWWRWWRCLRRRQ